jgi:2-dehydropantoate 2-reductase
MRIVVIGGGGVGGLLAGLLARAGEDVALVARGAQLEAVRREGLSVESPLGTFRVRVPAEADPAALAPADAAIVAVKAWQVAGVAPTLAPLVARGGVVVPMQNGVEAPDRLAAALGAERVAGGTINVLAWIAGPGRIQHVGTAPRIALGERGAPTSARLEALAAALNAAGAEASVTADIDAAMWDKFLFVEPWGTVGAASRAPIGVMRTVPETRALLERTMREVDALARARGVRLPANTVEAALRRLEGVPPDATVSMQRDLGAGRPSELDDQAGAVVRLAREAGVPVPAHDALYAALVPQERAARGELRAFART